MGQNGHKNGDKRKTVISGMVSDGSLPGEASSPAIMRLVEACRRKKEQGVDTTHIERFIEEGIVASIEGNTLYAEVMLQIAYDSLQL